MDTAGADIRVTGANGTTQVPREMVAVSTAGETGELHFKAPSLNSTSDTHFYIYYDNPSASAIAASDSYGAQNVWSNGYDLVWHPQETTGDTVFDSTANHNDGSLISDLVWFGTAWDHRKKITIEYTNDGFGPTGQVMVVDAIPNSVTLADTAEVTSGPAADAIEYRVGGSWQSAFDPAASQVRWIFNGSIDPTNNGPTVRLRFQTTID